MATLNKSAAHDAQSEPVKFQFDVEFTRGGAATRAAIEAAEAEAFKRGQAVGEAEANARIERRLGTVINQAS